MQVNRSETYPFIDEIIECLPEIIRDLEPAQIQTFYESLGHIISAQVDPEARQRLVFGAMELPNQTVRVHIVSTPMCCCCWFCVLMFLFFSILCIVDSDHWTSKCPS